MGFLFNTGNISSSFPRTATFTMNLHDMFYPCFTKEK